jgi:hypothetical protein
MLKGFNEDKDLLILMGDPAHIGWACYTLCSFGISPHTMKWDNRLQGFYTIPDHEG